MEPPDPESPPEVRMEDSSPPLIIPPAPSSISFREVVANSSQWFPEAKSIIFNPPEWDDSLSIPPDCPNVVSFSKNDLDLMRKPWQLTLMGKCLGINIRPSFMSQRIKIMWRPKGQIEVIDIGKSVFLFRFSMLDDLERALFGGPWFILDHYLMLTTWKPNFRPSMNPFSKLIVWIDSLSFQLNILIKRLCLISPKSPEIRLGWITPQTLCLKVDMPEFVLRLIFKKNLPLRFG